MMPVGAKLTPGKRSPILWPGRLGATTSHMTERISVVIDRVAIPAAHIDRLRDGGYVRDGRMGLVLTDLGQLRLKFEKGRLEAPKQISGARLGSPA